MSIKTLIVLGSGPGIGVGVACHFASHGFTHVALVSRDEERLAEDKKQVQAAIKDSASSVEIKTFVCDLTDLPTLKQTLEQLESFGKLNCVLYNAARVAGGPPLEESIEAIEKDFKLTNIALYETAKWAIPKLKTNSPSTSPSFFITSTTQLYKEPVPQLVSLSMVKSAQRALVLSLHAIYGQEVHIALLSVGGIVSPEAKNLNPANIAAHAWSLYTQDHTNWQREEEIHE